VGVEREADRGDDGDEPLQRRQTGSGLVHQKYLASVAAAGRDAAVKRDTITINNAEISVIGTTGNSPSTVVPAAALAITSIPANARVETGRPVHTSRPT